MEGESFSRIDESFIKGESNMVGRDKYQPQEGWSRVGRGDSSENRHQNNTPSKFPHEEFLQNKSPDKRKIYFQINK